MLVIISVILLVLAVVIAFAIVARKFPALAILDIESITQEKEAKIKDVLIKKRIDRDLAKWSGFIGNLLLKAYKSLLHSLELTQQKLKKIKFGHKISANLSQPEKESLVKQLRSQVDELIKEEEFAEAEKKLIDLISLDKKDVIAFYQLAQVLEDQKKYQEARQTFEYVLKLIRHKLKHDNVALNISQQEVYYSLALLENNLANYEAAYQNIADALSLEANNPRFLDLILDLSIIRKDKGKALAYYQHLAEVNPDNKKLAEKKELIDKL